MRNLNKHSRKYHVNGGFVGDAHPAEDAGEISGRLNSTSTPEPEPNDHSVPLGFPTKAQSIDFGLDDTRERNKRDEHTLMCLVIFFVISLTACLGILLYFVLLNTVLNQRVDTDSSAEAALLTFGGSVTLNETFTHELNDTGSAKYREKEGQFKSAMDETFMDGAALSDEYNGVEVIRFEPGSIRIVFELYFSSAENVADETENVITVIQTTLEDALVSDIFSEFIVINDSLELFEVSPTTITAPKQSASPTTQPQNQHSTTLRPLSTSANTTIGMAPVADTTRNILTTPTTATTLGSTVVTSSTERESTEAISATTPQPISTVVTKTTLRSTMATTSHTTPLKTTSRVGATSNIPSTSATVATPQRTSKSSTPPQEEQSTLEATTATLDIDTTTSRTTARVPTTKVATPATPTNIPVVSTSSSSTMTRTSSPTSIETSTVISASSSTPTSDQSTTTDLVTQQANITRQPKIHSALPDVCGIRPAVVSGTSSTRIVGGIQAAPGAWPWMGSLWLDSIFNCGASLIHEEWAITAHHCVGYFNKIVVGDNNLHSTASSDSRTESYTQSFPNNNFDHVKDENDIALVRLTQPVVFNDHVQPICINTMSSEFGDFSNCYVSGWGTENYLIQVPELYLKEASINLVNNSACIPWYEDYHDITDKHICAGVLDGSRDACYGDSGGPLQCQDEQGVWYLVGVVSFGQDCGQPRLPGVYTRVSTQITFLRNTLDANLK